MEGNTAGAIQASLALLQPLTSSQRHGAGASVTNMRALTKQTTTKLHFHPVTRERLPDLARFSEQHGKFRYCSCMRWRMKSTEFQRSKKEDRVAALEDLVRRNTPVGVLAYAEGEPRLAGLVLDCAAGNLRSIGKIPRPAASRRCVGLVGSLLFRRSPLSPAWRHPGAFASGGEVCSIARRQDYRRISRGAWRWPQHLHGITVDVSPSWLP